MQKSPFLTLVLLCWSTLAAAGKNTMMPDLQQVLGVAYDVPAELTSRAQPGSVLRWSAGRVGVFWSACLVAEPEEITVTEVNMQSQLAGGVRMRFGGIGVDASAGSTLVLNFESPYILTFDEGATTVITDDCRRALEAEARRGPIDELVLVTEAMFAKVNGCKKVVLQGRAGIFGQGARTETTTDCEIISDKPVAVGVRTVPASSLVHGFAPAQSDDTNAVVHFGGEEVDYEALAKEARAGGGGGGSVAAEPDVVVPGSKTDLVAMAARVATQQKQREREEAALLAEERRLAENKARLAAAKAAASARHAKEAAALQASIDAERKRRIAAERARVLEAAEADLRPLIPLFKGPMNAQTKRALGLYQSQYRGATIEVDGVSETVTIPGVARIERALAAEETRAAAAAVAEREARIAAAKTALLAAAQRDYTAIKPFLSGDLTDETRPVLEAFADQYADAQVQLGAQVEAVAVPGLAEVQRVLGRMTPGVSSDGAPNSVGMRFVKIPAGSFVMGCTREQGSDCHDDEKPAHKVTLTRSFYMQTTEVTQGQWRAVMGSNPSRFSGCNDCPVEQVSWHDAVAFAQKLSAKEGLRGGSVYRLPTEAEWEYAARAGQGTKYAGSNDVDAVAWHDGNSGSKTHPVGQKSPNAWGLYDMSGNVFEWTADWYGGYSSGDTTNPEGALSGSSRVLRGGSWRHSAARARVANRYGNLPVYRFSNLGFRLVRTIP